MGSRREFPFNFVNSFATSPLNESFKNVLEKDSQLDDRKKISMRDNFDAICEATTVGRSSERVNRAMILVKASSVSHSSPLDCTGFVSFNVRHTIPSILNLLSPLIQRYYIQGWSESCGLRERERDKRDSRGEQWEREEWNLLKSPVPHVRPIETI